MQRKRIAEESGSLETEQQVSGGGRLIAWLISGLPGIHFCFLPHSSSFPRDIKPFFLCFVWFVDVRFCDVLRLRGQVNCVPN